MRAESREERAESREERGAERREDQTEQRHLTLHQSQQKEVLAALAILLNPQTTLFQARPAHDGSS